MRVWLPLPGNWHDLCCPGAPSSVLSTSSLFLMWLLLYTPQVLCTLPFLCVASLFLSFFPLVLPSLHSVHTQDPVFTVSLHLPWRLSFSEAMVCSWYPGPLGNISPPWSLGHMLYNFSGHKHLCPLWQLWLHEYYGQFATHHWPWGQGWTHNSLLQRVSTSGRIVYFLI